MTTNTKQTQKALRMALDLALDVRANANARLAAKAIALTGVIDEALALTGSACIEQPAQQQEPVAWGVDWGKAGDRPCVSIIKRLPGGGIEVLATEYGPPASKPWVGLTDKEKKEIYRLSVYVEGAISLTEAKLREKNA